MSKVEGVLFDWAGTTVDFGCFAPVHVFLEIFKEAGVEITVQEARGPMGMLKKDHIRAILQLPRVRDIWRATYHREFTEKDTEDLYANFEPLLLTSLKEYSEPLPEVLETVKVLRNKGLKIGSTTGYTDSMMKIVTKGAQAQGYEPDYWITPDSTNGYGRPFPYMIFRNMEALKLTVPWKVVKVGDTAMDIQEGLNAGVWSVGVIVGSSQMGMSYEEYINCSELQKQQAIENAEQAFLQYGADFTIKTMKELPQVIEKINALLEQGKRPSAK